MFINYKKFNVKLLQIQFIREYVRAFLQLQLIKKTIRLNYTLLEKIIADNVLQVTPHNKVKVELPNNISKIISITGGCNYSVILTDQGLFGVGYNGYGQLGINSTNDQIKFVQIPLH